MPKIYTSERRGLIEQQPPGTDVSSRSFGQEGKVVQQIGGQLAEMGADLVVKMRREEDQSFAFQRSTDFELFATEAENNLKLSYPENRIGYAREYQRVLNERFVKDQKEAPTNRAKELYRNSAGGFFSRSIMEAQNFEFKEKIQFFKRSELENVEKIGRSLVGAPDPTRALDHIQKVNAQIDFAVANKRYDPETAKAIKDHAANKFAMSVFDGYYSKKNKASAINAIVLLKSPEDGEGKITQYLKAEQKADLLERFRGQLESMSKEDFSQIQMDLDDEKARILQGVGSAGNAQRLLQNLKNLPFIDSKFRNRVQREIKETQTTIQIGDAMTKMKELLITEWGKYEIKPTGKDTKDELLLKRQFESYKGQLLKEAYDDPNAWVQQSNPGLKMAADQVLDLGNPRHLDAELINNYVKLSESVQMQKGFGKASIRPLSKEMSLQIGRAFKGAETPAAQNQVYEIIRQSSGDRFDKVFDQLVNDGVIHKKAVVLQHINDPEARIAVFENIQRGSDHLKIIQQDPMKRGMLPMAINQNKDLQDVIAGLRAGDPSFSNVSMAQALIDQVSIESAKNYAITDSPSEAVEAAVGKILKDFQPISAGRTKLLVPSMSGKTPVDTERVKDFIDDVFTGPRTESDQKLFGPSSDVYFKEVLKVHVPKSYSKPDEYYNRLYKYGSFITNKDRTGLNLIEVGPAGDARPVFGEDGEPIEVKFIDIMSGKYGK